MALMPARRDQTRSSPLCPSSTRLDCGTQVLVWRWEGAYLLEDRGGHPGPRQGGARLRLGWRASRGEVRIGRPSRSAVVMWQSVDVCASVDCLFSTKVRRWPPMCGLSACWNLPVDCSM